MESLIIVLGPSPRGLVGRARAPTVFPAENEAPAGDPRGSEAPSQPSPNVSSLLRGGERGCQRAGGDAWGHSAFSDSQGRCFAWARPGTWEKQVSDKPGTSDHEGHMGFKSWLRCALWASS